MEYQSKLEGIHAHNARFSSDTVILAKLDKSQIATDSITIGHLLTFTENSIRNLYSFDHKSNIFRFEHQEGEFLARASCVLNPLGVRFTAEYLENPTSEYGISYVGFIQVYHLHSSFDIKMPGELSYDPGCASGDKPWVDFYQMTKIVIFVSVLMKAALLGATKKFLKRLFIVIKPIISLYYQKDHLFRWMYKQIKYACIYKKQPLSYPMYLRRLRKSYSESVQNYLSTLDMMAKGRNLQIIPPPEYFKGIYEDSSFNTTFKLKYFEDEEPVVEDFNEILEDEKKCSVYEMKQKLKKTKERYEEVMSSMINDLQDKVKANGNSANAVCQMSIFKPFSAQCPVF
ncbi:hypothetical protein SteCoe_22610 [Stentor coeruleus]|uniref:Uncharacterized protein n=1 Tax=Stentor coeruleus TaxID=5963 RepID=A0A1R2BLW3_9CILI|nr:hypothetical protein SteCoe_22610 [Stentor coeruleus]